MENNFTKQNAADACIMNDAQTNFLKTTKILKTGVNFWGTGEQPKTYTHIINSLYTIGKSCETNDMLNALSSLNQCLGTVNKGFAK
ncbi:hypothetical protein Cyrtocomes_00805 [Candidatus Cyrtobacter comes]|uniref:Uncharacterized protein n=1 Tax=Candidatus Cyrtobacter comes TaxID=675776 RepID=A0ABU5L8H9_9RICK|nr:hypothetical protein [Candidatus Cyrtobacter comes]